MSLKDKPYDAFKVVVCIKNLTHTESRITESLAKHPFPRIGERYKIKENILGQLSFFDFRTKVDKMGIAYQFSPLWFVPEYLADCMFKQSGIRWNHPEGKAKINIIYQEKSWLPIHGFFTPCYREIFYLDFRYKFCIILESEFTYEELELALNLIRQEYNIRCKRFITYTEHPNLKLIEQYCKEYDVYLVNKNISFGESPIKNIFTNLRQAGVSDNTLVFVNNTDEIKNNIDIRRTCCYIKENKRNVFAFIRENNEVIKL